MQKARSRTGNRRESKTNSCDSPRAEGERSRDGVGRAGGKQNGGGGIMLCPACTQPQGNRCQGIFWQVWLPCSGSGCFSEHLCFAVHFASHSVICLPASCCAPASSPIFPCMLIARYSRSHIPCKSPQATIATFAMVSFPLLFPSNHLLIVCRFFPPLLIYKHKYIHSSASTGLILSKTHCSFSV